MAVANEIKAKLFFETFFFFLPAGGSSSSSSFSSASSVGASLKPVVVGGVASFGDKENAAIAQFDIDKVTRPTGCSAWLNQVRLWAVVDDDDSLGSLTGAFAFCPGDDELRW